MSIHRVLCNTVEMNRFLCHDNLNPHNPFFRGTGTTCAHAIVFHLNKMLMMALYVWCKMCCDIIKNVFVCYSVALLFYLVHVIHTRGFHYSRCYGPPNVIVCATEPHPELKSRYIFVCILWKNIMNV